MNQSANNNNDKTNHFTNENIATLENQILSELDFAKLNEVCDHLTEGISQILNSCGIYFRIFTRVKNADSIAKKILRGKYGTKENPKNIQDLIGLRIVLYYYDDLSICRDIIGSTFQLIGNWSCSNNNPNEFKATKTNGVFRFPAEYFRLYTKPQWTLPIDTTFEIQFRTVFFEGWHEIEHDMRYKSPLSDEDFWSGSEELSRMLNCILANLELSDWSLVELFDKLSYNHYKNSNWELMLKSKFRIRMNEHCVLDPRIVDVFNKNRQIAKMFFKASRRTLIIELLKMDNPTVDYNLIVKLLNNKVVHCDDLTVICDSIVVERDEKAFQKNVLSRLETDILFNLKQPLLHKETRKLESEFNNAASIIYKWARFKFNPVFEDIPPDVCTYSSYLPGYGLKTDFDFDNTTFKMELHHIDSTTPGTIWNIYTSITRENDRLIFSHTTSRHIPRGVSHPSSFSKPSYLPDLSSKVGIMDICRLGSKAHIVASQEKLLELKQLILNENRKLPVVVIVEHSKDENKPDTDTSSWNYDMNTFTINGTRLAKVVGHYSHIFMIDYSLIDEFSKLFKYTREDCIGCICIFWDSESKKLPDFFSRKMVIETQFDFNRFAFHEENIYEKAFRHKLVQIIKNQHINN